MDTEREAVYSHELWPLKLKLLEANYEKSKLKIRESSLYCRLSIIQLKNIVDEEKFITEKYERRAVAERLLVAKEQVEKHAKEKEAISKKSEDDLKKTEEEWKGKITELTKINKFLEEKKEKETQSNQVLIEEISRELDILKKKENDWKTENARLLSKVEIMEKQHEIFSKHLAIKKVDKEVQAETFDVRQVDGGKNGEKNKMELTHKSQNIITPKSLKILVPEARAGEIDVEKIDEDYRYEKLFSDGENDYNPADTLSCTSRRKSSRLLKPHVEKGIPSSMKETEKVLRSCRRRSQRSRSVSPENKNSDDITGSKRSRRARCVLDLSASHVAKKLEKKKRRVTFSGELRIREFDKSKEWEEICQEELNEHYYLGKPREKQELIDDTSVVARDVLSVKTSDLIQQEVIVNDPNQEEGYQNSDKVKKKKKKQLRKQRGAQQLTDGSSSVANDVLSVETSDLIPQKVILNDLKQEDVYQESGEVKKKKQLRKQRGAQQLTDGSSSVASDVLSVETSDLIPQKVILNDLKQEDVYQESGEVKKKKQLRKQRGAQQLTDVSSSVASDILSVETISDLIPQKVIFTDLNQESGEVKKKKQLRKQRGDECLTGGSSSIAREVFSVETSNERSVKDGKAKCERKNRRKRGKNENVSEALSTAGESAVQRKQAEGVTVKIGAENKSSEDCDVLASEVIQYQEDLNNEHRNYSEEKTKRKAKGKAEDGVRKETPREAVNRPGNGKDGVEEMEEENSYEDIRRTKRKKSVAVNSQRTSNETVSESESSVSKEEEEHSLNGKRKSRKRKKATSLSVKNQSRKNDLSVDIATTKTTRPTRGKRGIPAVPDETKDKGVQQDGDTSKETLQVETDLSIEVFPNSHSTNKEASLGNETNDCDEHRMETRQRGSTRTMAVLREEVEEEEREVGVTEETTEQGKRRNTDVIQEECSTSKDVSLNESGEKEIKQAEGVTVKIGAEIKSSEDCDVLASEVIQYQEDLNNEHRNYSKEKTKRKAKGKAEDGVRKETPREAVNRPGKGKDRVEEMEEENSYEDIRRTKRKKSVAVNSQRTSNETVSESESSVSKEEEHSLNGKRKSRKRKKAVKNQSRKNDLSLDIATTRTTKPTRGKRGISAVPDETKDKGIKQDGDTSKETVQVETDLSIEVFPNSHSTNKEASLGNETNDCDEHRMETRQRGSTRTMAVLREEVEEKEREVGVTEETTEQGKRRNTDVIQEECSTSKDVSLNETGEKEIKQAEGVTVKIGTESKSSEDCDVLTSEVIQYQEDLNNEHRNYSEEKTKRKAKGKAEDGVRKETPREAVNRPGKGKDRVEEMEEENSYEDIRRTKRKKSVAVNSQRTSNETVSESESSVSKEEEHSLNGKRKFRKRKKAISLSVKNQSRKNDLSLDIATTRTTKPTRGKRGISAVPDETKDKGIKQDGDTSKETVQVETDLSIEVFPNSHSTNKEAFLGNETNDCDEHRMETKQRGSTRTIAVLREEEDGEEREVDVTKETTEQGKRNTDVIQEECSTKKDVSLNETGEKEIKKKAVTRSRKAKGKKPAINDKSEGAAESPKGKIDGKTSVTRKGRSRNKEAFLNDDLGNDSEEAEKKVYRTRQRAVKGGIVESSTKVDKKEEEMKGLKETSNTGGDKDTVLAINRKASRNEAVLNCEQGGADRENDGEIAAIYNGSEDIEKYEVGERDKTPEEYSVEITPVVRKDQSNIGTRDNGNGEKGRGKVTRQRGSKRGTTEQNKETEGNIGKQEMKDTMIISEKGKKRRSCLVNEKFLSNEEMLKGTTQGGGQKSDTRTQGNVSEIHNEATGNKKVSLGKTSSKLELPSGSSNVTIGQQTTSTAVNLQAPMNVNKAAKKKRRTLHSNKENSRMMNETNLLFQETRPLNSTRSTGGMPPLLASFMKAFIVPKLKN